MAQEHLLEDAMPPNESLEPMIEPGEELSVATVQKREYERWNHEVKNLF